MPAGPYSTGPSHSSRMLLRGLAVPRARRVRLEGGRRDAPALCKGGEWTRLAQCGMHGHGSMCAHHL